MNDLPPTEEPHCEQEGSDPLLEDDKRPRISWADKRPYKARLYAFSAPALMFIILVLATMGLFVALDTSSAEVSNVQGDSKISIKPCGRTPADAKKRGCRFDVISFCWLPEECFDAELTRDFQDANNLEWFRDPNRTEPLTLDQIMSGEHTGLYVNWEYHMRRCTAMWKKMHRAIIRTGGLGKGAIDSYIGHYEHTTHCEHMLLAGRNIAPEVINTRIAVKYPDCGI
ncbi:hypothetical protein CNYM01_08479 [Colletotrichum nymphaeae SA-01]|uniref:Uncharacterized protein n=1 Tax=Colletotrichum nymphaeae SA-01 TaxID=1460502 RepID=A0A135TEB0_9PEZI|nr:hypothetical protein CNYM01_08479 [Colletotrichum nymphaeae SA-01]